MATKTVVCPECDSPLAPGRFACSRRAARSSPPSPRCRGRSRREPSRSPRRPTPRGARGRRRQSRGRQTSRSPAAAHVRPAAQVAAQGDRARPAAVGTAPAPSQAACPGHAAPAEGRRRVADHAFGTMATPLPSSRQPMPGPDRRAASHLVGRRRASRPPEPRGSCTGRADRRAGASQRRRAGPIGRPGRRSALSTPSPPPVEPDRGSGPSRGVPSAVSRAPAGRGAAACQAPRAPTARPTAAATGVPTRPAGECGSARVPVRSASRSTSRPRSSSLGAGIVARSASCCRGPTS